MKNVIISADGDRMVYSVPNMVAERLEQYCMEFCNEWYGILIALQVVWFVAINQD